MGDSRSTRINVDIADREATIDELNICLAQTLYSVLASKFAHWNVKGPGFHPTHLLFDQIFHFYINAADRIGERIATLGGDAKGLAEDAFGAGLAYGASATDNVYSHTTAMADMLGIVVNQWRDVAKSPFTDSVTQNMLTELGDEGEKQLYFLEASLRAS